ncbi:hypothetical protein RJ641_026058 [Dillenia turbinata]|uniref:Protein ABIL5 n=1 Tax=Dillenia turbinata TaxID=194707 RepID=A0AAN8ZP49_9MAGN
MKEMMRRNELGEGDPQANSEEANRFHKSLHELRDLRSQLHCAADYCERKFLSAKQKKTVIENTKEYISRAIVTVVDHVGTVSANLESPLHSSNAISEAELRIDCLNQRLQTCQQYAQKLALSRTRWCVQFPKYNPRYIAPPKASTEKSNGVLRETDSPFLMKPVVRHEFDAKEDAQLFLYTCSQKPSLAERPNLKSESGKKDTNSAPVILPVRDGLLKLSKARNPSFHFQNGNKLELQRRSLQSSDILSLIRRTKRAT